MTETDENGVSRSVAVLLVTGIAVAVLTIATVASPAEPVVARIVGVAALAFVVLPVVAGTFWLEAGAFDGKECRRVVAWSFAGAFPMCFLAGLAVVYQSVHGIRVANPAVLTGWVASAGSLGGFLTGLYDVRRSRTHEQLRDTSTRLRAIIEASPVAIVAIDRDRTVETWSQAATDIFGWEREEVIGEPYPLVPDDRQEEFDEHVQRVDDGETLTGVETRRQHRDGSLVDVSIWSSPIERDGEVVGHMISLADITERKEREADLRLLERAIEQAEHAVIITDSEGVIEYVNPAFEDMTGYASAEVIGETPRLLKSGEQDEAFYADLWETITAGEVWEAELVNRRKNGERYAVEQTIAPIEHEGQIAHFVALEREITERRRDQERLNVLSRVLRHNLRNAVTAIDGYATTLSRDVRDEGERTAVGKIRRRAENLGAIAEKARTVEQALATERRRELSVPDLLERVRDQAVDTWPHLELTVEYQQGLELVGTTAVEDALIEAIENAVEHTDATSPTVRITAQRDGDKCEIRVADDGPGLPDHEQQVLTDGEETQLRHGSGVGLWLMKWVTDSAGGSLHLEERDPRGTLVTFTFPTDSVQAGVRRRMRAREEAESD